MFQFESKPIRVPEEGNPLYPLPADYGKMDSKEQHYWRMNALFMQETPRDLVWAWSFFRSYYLKQTRPGFFYKRYKESPKFHFQIVEDIGKYPFNAIAAPRASAKSTVLAIEIPLLLSLTRPFFNILLVFSKDTMVTKRMTTQLAYQFFRNPYIVEDFGKDIKPPKGQGAWNAHLMQLSNGASLEACSVMGGMLGARPDLILIDDPEIDPVMNRVTSELKENYERLLTNHILPMLDEGGSSLYWIGTLLSKQCFLYHVVTTKSDDRFSYWNRRLLDAEDDGQGGLLWEEKWNQETLDEDKRKLGIAAYNAQRRNRPGTGEEQMLRIHPDLGAYEIEGEVNTVAPLDSQCKLRSWRAPRIEEGTPIAPKLEQVERDFAQTVSGMFRVMTMDYARCLSPTSDYIAITVIGLESSKIYSNVWWVLDLYVGRISGNEWVKKFWDMAIKWRVQYAGVEAVAAQETLVHTLHGAVEEATAIEGWTPRVVPIRYPYGLSKEDRISSLEWRFTQNKIKFKRANRHKWPWRELYHEIEGFNGMPGGTQHDDALDALAMVQFLIKGGHRRASDEGGQVSGRYDLGDELKNGNMQLPGGIQTGLGVSPSELPHEVLMKLRDAHMGTLEDQDDRNKGLGLCITNSP